MRIEYHPAADLFPMLQGEEFAELVADIKRNGVIEPVVLYDGKILDGRNRYRAAAESGTRCPTTEWRGECGDPVSFVISRNIQRRQLTTSQRAICAAKARELYDQQAKERQRGGQGGKLLRDHGPQANAGRARDLAGRAFSVSGRSVERATAVISKGVPELTKAVEDGRLTVRAAAEIAAKPEGEQREELSRPRPAAPAKKEEPRVVSGATPGKGVMLANEAINCLIRIPKNDPLRKRGFQIVTDWIRANK